MAKGAFNDHPKMGKKVGVAQYEQISFFSFCSFGWKLTHRIDV